LTSVTRASVPGDKSITQRALILSALSEGKSRLSGLLHGGDADSTAGALRALGVQIPLLPSDGGEIRVQGVGLNGLVPSDGVLDLGNSGTGARLLTGVLAGSPVDVTLDGDASLRARPMARVVEPLTAMGANFEYEEAEGVLPLAIHGRSPLAPLDWSTRVASAQVKSAILLAGLTGGAFAMVTEPRRSRDHTERLLNQVGASVVSHAVAGGWRVELRDPPARIDALDFSVPGDMSSAAFLLALGVLGGAGSELTVEDVGLNPTRIGFLEVLRRMGADMSTHEHADSGTTEPRGNVTVSPADLQGVVVEGDEVPGLIDELPMVAVLAAVAEGETRISGARELRAKESDRITALVTNLRAIGVEVEELEDGLVVQGTNRPLAGNVRAFSDHRIVMAFSVLAALDVHEIEISGASLADVSFPGFRQTLHRLAKSA
jgi:3-phosphoshikimate 1-carboxyvinyltransferase